MQAGTSSVLLITGLEPGPQSVHTKCQMKNKEISDVTVFR